jgi:acetyl esterase/lipase
MSQEQRDTLDGLLRDAPLDLGGDVHEQRVIFAEIATADVAVTLQVTPGVPHAFQAFAAMLDEGDAALTSAGAFLRTHFAADPRA